MKNWKVLITICVLGCTRICAQETGANDTVSRHPLTHGVGIDFRPVYLIPTNEFFAGENAAWQPLRKSVSAHLKYSFRFHPDSRYGKLYPHTYQGIGVSYHSFFDKAEIGTPMATDGRHRPEPLLQRKHPVPQRRRQYRRRQDRPGAHLRSKYRDGDVRQADHTTHQTSHQLRHRLIRRLETKRGYQAR